MDVHEALYTTRAMRRLKPDPISLEVQARILDAAIRAPSGGNIQGWRFVLVDDPATKAVLGHLYRDALAAVWESVYKERLAAAHADPTDADNAEFLRGQRSGQHLADHFESVPLFLLAFVQDDTSGASVFPAVWSAMLAARAEGIGSVFTTVMSMLKGPQVLQALRVPLDEGWTNVCCIPFGYPTGRWGVAPRLPADQVSFRNAWGNPVAFTVPAPLWSPAN